MRRIILILIILFCATNPLSAQLTSSTVRINGYYPIPNSVYPRFRLVPIAQLTENPCIIGTFYNNRDQGNSLYYCRNAGTLSAPLGKWDPAPEVWFENQNATDGPIIALSDQTIPATKKVGIGTDAPDFKLTLEKNSGIFAKGTFGASTATDYASLTTGAYFIWWPKKAALRAGTVTLDVSGQPLGTSWDPSLVGNYSVAFGRDTRATATGSVVASGANNRTGESSSCGPYSTIIGGEDNQMNFGKEYLVIGGGQSHQLGNDINAGLSCSTTGASYEFIGGGKGYMLGKNYTTVIGGEGGAYPPSSATIPGPYNSIGGGLIPTQTFDTADYLTALGGSGHTLNSDYGTLAGGQSNTLSGRYSFIGGGFTNATNDDYAVIGGGQNNSAAAYATVLGGGGGANSIYGNSAAGNYSTILGGWQIKCYGNHASCGGGQNNQASSLYSYVGGGLNNTISSSGLDSAIAFGYTNNIGGENSFIGGGYQNTILGNFSVIPGNYLTTVSGHHSLATSSRNLTVSSDNTFAFAAQSATPLTINSPDSFIIYAINTVPALNTKVGIGTTTPTERLHVADGNIRVDGNLILSNPGTAAAPKSPLIRDTDGTLGYDLAERFPTSEEVEAGDVVIIDTASDKITLRRSSQAYDKRAIGVVSLAPAIILSSENLEMNAGGTPSDNASVPIALSGRILCKVSLENGPIAYGDLLTTSSLAGHAMRADRDSSFGTVIGKALEPFPNTNETQHLKDTGVVMIMVTLQ